MCRLLGVARSSFYAWRSSVDSAAALRRRELCARVAQAFAGSRGTYGCRRVAAALHRQGVECRVGLVADLMRELGLRARQPRADQPGTRLVGDITYLRTGEGWLYLATVIDLATRMVVGWQLADHLRTRLVVDAPAMALTHGHVRPGAIFHSDRGCQYTSQEFAALCARRHVQTSVGRTGVCWDNATAESFFAALKNEMYHCESFPTRARARSAVADYIEIFYNRQRLHSALGYRTPNGAYADHVTATAA